MNQQAKQPRYKKLISIIIRLGITVTILFIIFNKIDLNRFFNNLSQTNIKYLFFAIVVLFFSYIVYTFVWKQLLNIQNLNFSFRELFGFYLVSLFFNNFFISTLGGDLMLIYQISQKNKQPIDSTLSVLSLKFYSLLSFIFIIVIMLAIGVEVSSIKLSTLIGFILISAVMIVLIHKLQVVQFSNRKSRLFRAIEKVHLTFKNLLMVYARNPKKFLIISLLSVTTQMISIIVVYLVSLSIGIIVPITYFITYIALIRIICMVPITINGLGLREGAYILLFANLGVSAEEAISISLVNFILITIFSLLGGYIYFFKK